MSLPEVFFASIVSSAVFFGAYIVLTAAALYLLSRRERSVSIIVMMILTVVMFGISATYFALDIHSVANGLFYPEKYPKTVINLWGPETTAQVILRGTSTVLGDSIVIWRAWVVWDRQLRVLIVPLVVLLGVGLSFFGMAFAQRHGPHNSNWVAAFMNFMIAVPCLTLAANVVATTLVLWRIYTLYYTVKKLERFEGGPDVPEIHGTGGARYHRLLIIIIESGGMYCLTWLLFLSFEFAGSPAVHVCLSIIGQLTGIYPTLIIVLVSLNLTQDHVQGLNDTGIQFGGSTLQLSTFSRTVNFTSAHDSHGLGGSSSGGNCEIGIAVTTEDGGQCVTDITKSIEF